MYECEDTCFISSKAFRTNWSISESWTPRENDKSGVYALKITSKDKEDYIPFFVTPKKPKAKGDEIGMETGLQSGSVGPLD